MTPIPLWSVAQRALKSLPRGAAKVFTAWLKWFWRLSRTAKIVATAVEIVALWFAAQHLPIDAASQRTVLDTASIGLLFLLIAGVLFGASSR